jgi:hypothetical protein
MLRRELLKALGAVPLVQLGPWLANITPATDFLNEIVDDTRTMYPECQIDFFVSNKFWRQLETEADGRPALWHPATITSQPGIKNAVTSRILLKTPVKRGKDTFHELFGVYQLPKYTHIKGLELLLESDTASR